MAPKDEYMSIEKIAEEMLDVAEEVNVNDLPPEVMTDGKGNTTLDDYVKSEEE